MKIISKFTDYYDKVAWTYGGGDPKIRYERHDLPEILKIEHPSVMASMSLYGKLHNKYDTRTLIVGERVYTIFSLCIRERSRGDGSYAPIELFLPDAEHEISTSNTRPG